MIAAMITDPDDELTFASDPWKWFRLQIEGYELAVLLAFILVAAGSILWWCRARRIAASRESRLVGTDADYRDVRPILNLPPPEFPS